MVLDAASPTGTVVPVGTAVTFDYVVSNTVNIPLANVVVTDDNGTADIEDDFKPAIVGGDTNNAHLLDLDETWTYQHTITAGAAISPSCSMISKASQATKSP